MPRAHDTFRRGVTVFECRWSDGVDGLKFRVNGQGHRIGPPAPVAAASAPAKPPHRRRDLEAIVDYDAVTPSQIAEWCAKAWLRLPIVRLVVSDHYLPAHRKRGLVIQFKHPLDPVHFKMDFREVVSSDEW